MEAGLPTTKGEERMMSKEPLLPDETPQPRTSRQTSTTRRVLIALAICSVLGLGLAALGGATHMCPGHLRTELGNKIENVMPQMLHDAIDNSTQRRARDARRRRLAARQQTPVPSSSSAVNTQTQANPTSQTNANPTNTQATATQASSAPGSQTQASRTEAQTSRSTSNNQPTSDSKTTAAGTSSSDEATRTSSSSPPSATVSISSSSPLSSSAASTSPTEITASTSPTETTADQTTQTNTEEPESTLTTGTQRTSSPVQKVFTSTLQDGGVTTLTSTSWLAVVPTADANTGKGGKPGLQNAGSQYSVAVVLQAALGMIVGGLLVL